MGITFAWLALIVFGIPAEITVGGFSVSVFINTPMACGAFGFVLVLIFRRSQDKNTKIIKINALLFNFTA
jgi:phosphoglycerol transferase MdoB-like AlkP superfamily enzyme